MPNWSARCLASQLEELPHRPRERALPTAPTRQRSRPMTAGRRSGFRQNRAMLKPTPSSAICKCSPSMSSGAHSD
eukprot:9448513-Pyramimonas_sp.AAC.1